MPTVKSLLPLIFAIAALGAAPAPKTPIAAIPWTDATEIAMSPFGVAIEKSPTKAPYSDVRGFGYQVPTDGSLFDKRIFHNYVGAKLMGSDCEVSRCRIFNNRDVNLWIARDAGNCQSHANHCYGARLSLYNEGAWQFRSTGDTIADSQVGCLLDAQSTFVGGMWQHNTVVDCVVRGGGCRFVGCTFNLQGATVEQNTFNVPGLPAYTGKSGLTIVGGGCSLDACTIDIGSWIHPAHHASGKPATGVVVAASDCELDGKIIDSDGLDGTTGILIAGPVKNLTLRLAVLGFGKSDRLLAFADGASLRGLEAELIVDGSRPIASYIDPAGNWTGTIHVVDTTHGSSLTLTKGQP